MWRKQVCTKQSWKQQTATASRESAKSLDMLRRSQNAWNIFEKAENLDSSDCQNQPWRLKIRCRIWFSRVWKFTACMDAKSFTRGKSARSSLRADGLNQVWKQKIKWMINLFLEMTVSHRVPLSDFKTAYDALLSGKACKIIMNPQAWFFFLQN